MGDRDQPLLELIERLAPVAYPALCEEYLPTCCIAAAAILTRVFREYGYRAEVIPATVRIYNAGMVKLLRDRVRIPDDEERREMFFELHKAWGVGIVPASAKVSALQDRRGGGYGGHLLLRVNRFLIDPTIRQAERPDKDINLPDMLYYPHAEEFAQSGRLAVEVNGCHVFYDRIDDMSYRSAPDWNRRSTPYPETVQKIIQRITAKPVSAQEVLPCQPSSPTP